MNKNIIETCTCGYFKYECECCGAGKICPVCGKPKNVIK